MPNISTTIKIIAQVRGRVPCAVDNFPLTFQNPQW